MRTYKKNRKGVYDLLNDLYFDYVSKHDSCKFKVDDFVIGCLIAYSYHLMVGDGWRMRMPLVLSKLSELAAVIHFSQYEFK